MVVTLTALEASHMLFVLVEAGVRLPKFKGAPKPSLVERAHPAAGDLNRAHSVDLIGGHMRAHSSNDGNRVATGVVGIDASQYRGPWSRLCEERGQSAGGVYRDRDAYRIGTACASRAVARGRHAVGRGR